MLAILAGEKHAETIVSQTSWLATVEAFIRAPLMQAKPQNRPKKASEWRNGLDSSMIHLDSTYLIFVIYHIIYMSIYSIYHVLHVKQFYISGGRFPPGLIILIVWFPWLISLKPLSEECEGTCTALWNWLRRLMKSLHVRRVRCTSTVLDVFVFQFKWWVFQVTSESDIRLSLVNHVFMCHVFRCPENRIRNEELQDCLK